MFNVPCSIARYDNSCVDLNVKENLLLIWALITGEM